MLRKRILWEVCLSLGGGLLIGAISPLWCAYDSQVNGVLSKEEVVIKIIYGGRSSGIEFETKHGTKECRRGRCNYRDMTKDDNKVGEITIDQYNLVSGLTVGGVVRFDENTMQARARNNLMLAAIYISLGVPLLFIAWRLGIKLKEHENGSN